MGPLIGIVSVTLNLYSFPLHLPGLMVKNSVYLSLPQLGFPFVAFLRFFFLWRCDPTRAMASSFLRFLDHTQRRITFGRTPLDEWSVLRRDLYLTTHNTHNRQTSMPPGGIRTHDLSRRAAADLRLIPRGHWDRPKLLFLMINSSKSTYDTCRGSLKSAPPVSHRSSRSLDSLSLLSWWT